MAESARILSLAVLAALAGILAGGGAAGAADGLAGPVAAEIVRTIDGDTLEVSARVWLGLDILTHIRLRGIDAPELHGKCAAEIALAGAAARTLAALAGGGPVRLVNLEPDKYFGRVVADVVTGDGTSLSDLMLRSGTVRPYSGGRRSAWCPPGP